MSVCPSVHEVFTEVGNLADAHHQNLVSTSSNETFFEAENKMLEVWPNPATDFLHIKRHNTALQNEQQVFRLFDVQGKIVFSKNLTAEKNDFSVDVSKFKTGIYTYQFLGGKMDVETGKVLVLE